MDPSTKQPIRDVQGREWPDPDERVVGVKNMADACAMSTKRFEQLLTYWSPPKRVPRGTVTVLYTYTKRDMERGKPGLVGPYPGVIPKNGRGVYNPKILDLMTRIYPNYIGPFRERPDRNGNYHWKPSDLDPTRPKEYLNNPKPWTKRARPKR